MPCALLLLLLSLGHDLAAKKEKNRIVIRCGYPGYCFLYPGQYTWLIGALPSLFFVCSYLAVLVFGYLFADIERARGPLASLANEANLAYG